MIPASRVTNQGEYLHPKLSFAESRVVDSPQEGSKLQGFVPRSRQCEHLLFDDPNVIVAPPASKSLPSAASLTTSASIDHDRMLDLKCSAMKPFFWLSVGFYSEPCYINNSLSACDIISLIMQLQQSFLMVGVSHWLEQPCRQTYHLLDKNKCFLTMAFVLVGGKAFIAGHGRRNNNLLL